ncbi:MAG: hypothetical protein IKF64_01600 [Eubacterium sp.]|nr:hypothetical protein [Eubacterium sp.]
MKKFLSVIFCVTLVFTMLFGFSACAGKVEINTENVTAAVEKTEKALQTFDTKKLSKYVDSKTLGVIIPVAEKKDAFMELGKAMFKNLSIEVVSVNEADSTVTVKVINKDLYNDASEFATRLNNNYSRMQLVGLLENEGFINSNLNPLISKIDEAPMLTEYKEVTLKVTQGKKNLVLSFDDEAEDAVSGGALGAIKTVFGI